MLKHFRRQYNIACVLADLGALVLSFVIAFLARRDLVPALSRSLAARPMFGLGHYVPVFILTSFVTVAVLFAMKAYSKSASVPLSSVFFLNLRGVAASFLSTLALAYLLKMTFLSRLFLLLFVLTFLVLSTAGKHLAALWFRRGLVRGRNLKNVVLVGANVQARRLVQKVIERPELGLAVKGFFSALREECRDDTEAMEALGLPRLGGIEDLSGFLEKEVVDGVVFCVGAGTLAAMEELFLTCEDMGVDTLIAANLFPHLVAQVHLERMEDLSFLRFTTVPNNPVALFVKRLMDVAVSSLCLLVSSPLLAGIALLVKSTSPGPVFFVQERVGLNGRRFRCLKFRTMVQDAEERKVDLETLNEADGPVFKIKDDPRITPAGRILRKLSLDELPQLWNVWKGEMSLVGPRPPIPSEVEKYKRWQRRRLSMRPGITCLWQISGRSEVDFETWMKLDLQYIDRWSLALDFLILLKTIPAVLSTRGAA